MTGKNLLECEKKKGGKWNKLELPQSFTLHPLVVVSDIFKSLILFLAIATLGNKPFEDIKGKCLYSRILKGKITLSFPSETQSSREFTDREACLLFVRIR